MFSKLQNDWRTITFFVLMLLMILALFSSRALLSISIGAFFIFSLIHTDHKRHWRTFISSPVLWGITLLFVVPVISGLWSENSQQWMNIIRIKLPLLLLPIAFATPITIPKIKWLHLARVFVAIVLFASLWSVFYYLSDMTAINESYLKAKTLNTPLENDHIRFSWLVAVSLLVILWICNNIPGKSREFVFWIFIAVYLVIYLHLLAVRTGLLSFYIILFLCLVFSITRSPKAKWIYLLFFVSCLLPLVSYYVLPSFKNRVDYLRYDFSFWKKAQYQPGSNDAMRLVSLRTGWYVMTDSPLTGVGFGDIETSMKKKYKSQYPDMLETDMILPASEWMVYGAGAGWPGLIIFSIVMILPFFTRVRQRFYWWIVNIVAAFSFLFDIGLEVQYGVFIYAFVIGWCWKWWNAEKM